MIRSGIIVAKVPSAQSNLHSMHAARCAKGQTRESKPGDRALPALPVSFHNTVCILLSATLISRTTPRWCRCDNARAFKQVRPVGARLLPLLQLHIAMGVSMDCSRTQLPKDPGWNFIQNLIELQRCFIPTVLGSRRSTTRFQPTLQHCVLGTINSG
jgi:hypothetical protein